MAIDSQPCYGCTERHPRCHSDCARFLEWDEYWKQIKKNRVEAINKYKVHDDYKQEHKLRDYRRHRNGGHY